MGGFFLSQVFEIGQEKAGKDFPFPVSGTRTVRQDLTIPRSNRERLCAHGVVP